MATRSSFRSAMSARSLRSFPSSFMGRTLPPGAGADPPSNKAEPWTVGESETPTPDTKGCNVTRRRTVTIAASFTALVSLGIAPIFVAGGTSAAASLPRAKATSGSITFGTPSVVDPVHTYGEPDIRVAPNGDVFDSGPWGTGTQRSMWEQSTDGGRTFHVLHQHPVSSPVESDSQIDGPGGADTEISIDHSNNVYYADLAALASLKVARWNPTTRTMDVGFFGNGQQNINGVDRQWFALWDPPSAPAGY